MCSSSFRGRAWRIPCCECNRPAHRGCISSIPQEIIGQLYKAKAQIDFLCTECSASHNVTSSDGVPGFVNPAAGLDLSAGVDDNLLASFLSQSLNISNNLIMTFFLQLG